MMPDYKRGKVSTDEGLARMVDGSKKSKRWQRREFTGGPYKGQLNENQQCELGEIISADEAGVLEKHLDAGLDPNANLSSILSTHPPRTLLMEASFLGAGDCLKLLISKGAHLNAYSSDGETALSLARFQSNKTVVSLLLEEGASRIFYPGGSFQKGKHVLFEYLEGSKTNAAGIVRQNGSSETVAELIRGVGEDELTLTHKELMPFEHFINSFLTGRSWGATSSKYDVPTILDAFINRKPELLILSQYWRVGSFGGAIMKYIDSTDDNSVQKAKDVVGATVHLVDNINALRDLPTDGQSSYKQRAFLKLYQGLLKTNPSKQNEYTKKGDSQEDVELEKSREEVLRELMKAARLYTSAAWWNVLDGYGNTPLHMAAEEGLCKIAFNMLGFAKEQSRPNGMAKWLDEQVNRKNKWGWTALHSAAASGCEVTYNTMKSEGVIMEEVDNDGRKPKDILNSRMAHKEAIAESQKKLKARINQNIIERGGRHNTYCLSFGARGTTYLGERGQS